jgi:hypothetical protein
MDTYTDVADPAAGTAEANTFGVTGVNHSGVIVGNFGFGPYNTHGFTKDVNGFVTIDVGAPGTLAMSINNAGTVVGAYFTWPRGLLQPPDEHAFIRTADGTITTFDDPALVTTTADSYGTVATGINSAGVIVGYSYTIGPDLFTYPDGRTDPVTRNHGFIRSSKGHFRTYDAPGAASSGAPNVGTRLLGINTGGAMVGAFTYLTSVRDGREPMNAAFVVAGNRFTRIVDPNPSLPTNSCAWHEAAAINDAGVIVGNSGNGCGNPGFREAWAFSAGVFTYLDYPYPDPPPWVVDPNDPPTPLTIASGVNNDGVISGQWGNGRMNGWSHGFSATSTTN